ncbi:Transposase and inactivated derivatives [Salipiger marinus]|uniref:Transposase and inactivated derivatives n=1 Tax=Salipiger marinus TaxID=555512 RepID=A0A1G8TCS7_9RHOB|nr:Transposase and inactivated derivatives [Salipiger marinus]
MTRRKFSREFNVEAVRLVTDRGVAVAQAARDLDLAESVLRRWMRELTAAPTAAFPGNGQMRADLAEIAALKKEVARLRPERDILKKAAVGSTGQRNSSLEGISRRLETKRFPRPCVEAEGGLIKVMLSVDR